MTNFLKGNFTVKNEVIEAKIGKVNETSEMINELKKKVLTSLGGSMVYMERTGLTWDGFKENESKNDQP